MFAKADIDLINFPHTNHAFSLSGHSNLVQDLPSAAKSDFVTCSGDSVDGRIIKSVQIALSALPSQRPSSVIHFVPCSHPAPSLP